MNTRPFAKLPGSRASVFAEREAPLLRALPAERYQHRTRKLATVHIDYHVELEGHYYSVPYHLVRERVELRFDCAHRRGLPRGRARRRASALRRPRQGDHPDRAHAREASRRGLLDARAHRRLGGQDGTRDGRPLPRRSWPLGRTPSSASASCLGVLRLGERYSPERLEAASARALAARRHLLPLRALDPRARPRPRDRARISPPVITHSNVRGADYYD